MRFLLWTNKSFRTLEVGLLGLGFTACHRGVGGRLRKLGYVLQADKKTLTIAPSHVDRDAQFEHLDEEAKKAVAEGHPVLSMDAKKKEHLGNFKECRPDLSATQDTR